MTDIDLNFVPENLKKIHLVSACGTAMGALCVMLKLQGYEITASDSAIYPPMSSFLENNGIEIFEYSKENIKSDIDLVVIGNAVTAANPEAAAVMEKKKNYISMPQALNYFFAKDKKIIMVCGTHGKTTTTGIISWILEYAGLEPSFFIGGIHKNFNSGFKIGDGNYFVIEGDEYDTAFFDKGSKFLHFKPSFLALTGIEYDHADIFNDIEEIKKSFSKLLINNASRSKVYAFDSSPVLKDVINFCNINEKTNFYGKKTSSNFFYEKNEGAGINQNYLFFANSQKTKIELPMTGEHNIFNSMAAITVCLDVGIEMDTIQKALKSYKGMKRRQELRGEVKGIKVFDDFAHHPTEVCYTIKGIKKGYSPKRLIAVFEPGTNTSMRNIFQKDYEKSFEGSDFVCIKKPDKINKVIKELRFSHENLKKGLEKKGINSEVFNTTEEILDYLVDELKEGDLVLVMSNKGFDNIHDKLLSLLGEKFGV